MLTNEKVAIKIIRKNKLDKDSRALVQREVCVDVFHSIFILWQDSNWVGSMLIPFPCKLLRGYADQNSEDAGSSQYH